MLKNYTSEGRNTFDKIQSILSQNGANKIMYDYAKDGTGRLEAITFAMELEGKQIGFRMPAMVDNVVEIMYGGVDRYGREKKVTAAMRDQAYKTAWANIRDWIDAQMALVATKQARVEQVFLPYLIVGKNDETLFDKISKEQFALGDGK